MSKAAGSKYQIQKSFIPLNKLVLIIFMLVLASFSYQQYSTHVSEQNNTNVRILAPQVDDIYFLNNRLIDLKSDNKNNYRLAKIVRVTDENVAIVYGRFFYRWQYAVVNSIKYGNLRNGDYFMSIPEYIPIKKIKEMRNNGAIYLVQRPVNNKLYGSFISPQ